MRQVIKYESIDGKIFNTEKEAIDWETRLNKVEDANFKFKSGADLYTILKISGLYPDKTLDMYKDILSMINRDTKLVITHWQCSERPGYSPVELKLDGRIHVWGNVGSWSGAYGADVGLSDICRYMRFTLESSKNMNLADTIPEV